MDQNKLREELFDTLLKAAVEEDFKRELDEIPPAKSLKDRFSPSPELGRKIRKLGENVRRAEQRKKTAKIVRKAALIFAALLSVSMISLLSVEGSRNAIFNAVLEWGSGHADVFYQPKGSSSGTAASGGTEARFRPQYIPAGFAEKDTVKVQSMWKTTYRNDKNTEIIFCQASLADRTEFKIDTENKIYNKVAVNGREASLFTGKKPDDKTALFWKDGGESLELISPINPQELIKMAESVKQQKN